MKDITKAFILLLGFSLLIYCINKCYIQADHDNDSTWSKPTDDIDTIAIRGQLDSIHHGTSSISDSNISASFGITMTPTYYATAIYNENGEWLVIECDSATIIHNAYCKKRLTKKQYLKMIKSIGGTHVIKNKCNISKSIINWQDTALNITKPYHFNKPIWHTMPMYYDSEVHTQLFPLIIKCSQLKMSFDSLSKRIKRDTTFIELEDSLIEK